MQGGRLISRIRFEYNLIKVQAMKLPSREKAIVPLAKLENYLLSESHSVGKSKAKFFRSTGFDEANVDLLEQGLLGIVQDEDVIEIQPTQYGSKYVIEGALRTPLGSTVRVRTVWIIEKGGEIPRFVTAYPSE